MQNEFVISVEGLRKVFNNTIVAVDDISFKVKKGEVFSLLGPNGAGKTTTVEILEGLQDPTSGDATVLGTSIKGGFVKIRERIGVLPQEFEPFDLLKPPEFLRYFGQLYGKNLKEEEITDLLKTVGLNERRTSVAMNLSGGEKRKLGIAVSLVSDPELLFLDEPTTGLDPQARRSLWSLITNLKDEGKTVILTTHYLEEAEELSDRVAVMNHGKIIAMGTPRELMDKAGGEFMLLLEGASTNGIDVARKLGLDAFHAGPTLNIRIGKGESVKEVILRLNEAGVEYRDLYTTKPTLEDAFLSLVGAKLENGVLKE
jgi:ABC-2 type transport system ATP-binding protein